MDIESDSGSPNLRSLNVYWKTVSLVYQSFGVVYGDLSTSPIYVFESIFSGKLKVHTNNDDIILGVLSLIFWTLTLIPLCKYIILVLGADDNGEGGTFALYSLLCRSSKMSLLNNAHAAHEQLSPCSSGTSLKETRTSTLVKEFFEKHRSSRIILLLAVLLGTSMVIGDGVLTPSMSDFMVFIACVILVALFALQHYGTHRVGFLFAPIVIAWLLCIGGVGIYNTIYWNPAIVRALSPYYAYKFFKKAGKDGWMSLGSIVLCITGAEAMFADLGHFSKLSIRIAFTGAVYPCLVLAYMGEAAYLSKNLDDIQRGFFKAIPDVIFWPVFIIATLATVVGSQAIISATFSIISQCRALRCFPRVKILHTSSQVHGQIYIPEVNWILLVLCIVVVTGFRDTHMIGNAYGLAVVTVMFVTTCLMLLIIVTVWKQTVFSGISFVTAFGSIELLYISACLVKIPHGGWVPVLLSLVILSVMYVWHYGTSKKEEFELQNKVCLEQLMSLGPSLGIVRVPGIGLVYSNMVSGITPMFAHFMTNFPAFHRIVVFVTLQSLTVPKVPANESFLIGRIGPPEFCLFRCIIRYGYKDSFRDCYDFENQLIMKVVEFLQCEGEKVSTSGGTRGQMMVFGTPSRMVTDAVTGPENNGGVVWRKEKVGFTGPGVREEVKELLEAREAGVTYITGQTCVIASKLSSFVKRFAIDIVYGFLRRNCRHPAIALGIPYTSLIEVGMVYYV